MSKRTSRSVRVGRKIKLPDNRTLPEPADDMTVEQLDQYKLDDAESEHLRLFGAKVDPFTMADLSIALPRCPSSHSRLSISSSHSPYYPQRCDSGNSSADWDDYWYPCESESSDFSQSATSFMSWSDEVEVETTKKVQEMYDAAERFLYDEGSSQHLSAELIDECLQWKAKFKHLRVVGVGLNPVELNRGPFIDEDSNLQVDEILASHSDSDEEDTLHCDEVPSFIEISDDTDCLKYDDVTMGSKCEVDQSVLREKVATLVVDGLFAYVWPKVENVAAQKLSVDLPRIEIDVTRDKNVASRLRPSSHLSSRSSFVVSGRKTDSVRLQQIDVDETLHVAPISLRRSAKSNYSARNRIAGNGLLNERPPSTVCHSAYHRDHVVFPKYRSVITTPLDLRFTPQVVESRAYHSALNRQTSDNPAALRRLSSLSTRGGQRGITRQDEILKNLKEEQDRLLQTNTGNSQGTNRAQFSVNGSSTRKPRSGYSNVTLPPISATEWSTVSRGRPKMKVAQTKSLSPRPNTSRTLEPLSLPASFEIQGTGMSRLELAKQIAESRTYRM